MYEISYGWKYERSLDVAEIAKRIRQQIKNAIAAGALPQLQASVKISRFAGGQSIDIRVVKASFQVLNHERVLVEHEQPHTFFPTAHYPIYTLHAVAALKQLQSMLDAYNYDGSEIQVDYHNVNFYGHAEYSNDLREREREQIVAEGK
jgi:hypothetical protein